MSDEKSQQQTSTESTVAGAAKTGKAISNIAKGAAAGGAHGAAIEAGKSSAKWLIPLIAAVLLPLILVAMLPSIIFGSLLGDGTDSPNGISNDEVLVKNMTAINEGISSILSEGLTDVLERIDSDFASSGCDGKEINNPFGADVVFNANAFVSQYCAHKDTEIASISKEDMEALLTANKDKLYSFAFTDEEREIPPEQGDEDSGETIHETIRIYTISYNGEAYFADQVFHLSDDQKLLASQYAQNLTVLLGDGIYQGLSETEFSATDLSYDGVVFADGETQVVYYNQLDERWKYSPYGTDTIGGYACGPTAMAIVISSLTSETIDPPHMAQWAYEHGYWCSGNGSYRSLIPGAAQAWSLSVDGCTASEPQRIIDALAEGKLVVALMTKGHFTSSGHFIVLRGCTSDGKILVADPSSYKHIPPNFLASGRLFGGMIRARNAIEACVLVLLTGIPIIKLPMSLTVRIIILCLLPLPLGIFGIIGFEGDSLSEFAINWVRWFIHRRSLYRSDVTIPETARKQKKRIWEQEATKPPEELGIRIKQPRKKGKRPTKTEKQLNKNNRKMVPSHKKQVTYSEDFVPVKDIRNGIIEMEDGRYIKVLEVEPINFLLRSTSEQKNIVASFASWMKISPIKIQIKVLTKKADIGKHLSTIERDMESESTPSMKPQEARPSLLTPTIFRL